MVRGASRKSSTKGLRRIRRAASWGPQEERERTFGVRRDPLGGLVRGGAAVGRLAMYIEHFGKSVENNRAEEEEEERTENFPHIPETPVFLRSLEAVKTPQSVEKLQFPKSPFFEM
ncbi:Protein SIX6OS1 [Cricetulus griseus]|uniref:Protein SIX6OS1 n=1 Tax=Cricetulus griseus TaxID=10029 RepID=G3IBN2_CRIGR|nr:Protein SIX6OS1 [Cricetulus griseus]